MSSKPNDLLKALPPNTTKYDTGVLGLRNINFGGTQTFSPQYSSLLGHPDGGPD